MFIAPFDGQKTDPAADGSDVKTIMQDIIASNTFTRVGSIIDLNLSEDFAANTVTVEADECDTGEICRQCTPEVTIEATTYECKNPQMLNYITGVDVFADGSELYSGYKITAGTCPRVIVYIETCADEDGRVDRIMLVDAFFNGAMVSNLVNIVRAGGLEGSPLSFLGAKGGCVLRCRETVDTTAGQTSTPTPIA